MESNKTKKDAKKTFIILLTLGIILTIALVAGLAYVFIFGITTYYGDTKITYVKSISEIRQSNEICGSAKVVYKPNIEYSRITKENFDLTKKIIEARLVNKGISDYNVKIDDTHMQIIVNFSWKYGDEGFDPTSTAQEIGATSLVSFCNGTTKDDVILQGSDDIKSATYQHSSEQGNYVALKLTSSGASKFASATSAHVGDQISIWLDDTMISAPIINQAITNGEAIITGDFTAEEAKELADIINTGPLPYPMYAVDFTTE